MASKRKVAYYAYLESAHWKHLRQEAFKRDGYRCCNCGDDKNLRGHHIRYRKNIRLCTVDDIQTLCVDCHESHHRSKKQQRKRNRAGRKAWRKLLQLPDILFSLPIQSEEGDVE